MTDWTEFTARIQPLDWGDTIYTVLPLPEGILAALGRPKRVEGEVNDYPINLAVTRAPVIDTAFLWTGKSLLDAAGLTPGEEIEVRLRPADPNAVDTPPEIAAALHAAGRSAHWEALTPGKRRDLIHQALTAKRADTRAKRIATLISELT